MDPEHILWSCVPVPLTTQVTHVRVAALDTTGTTKACPQEDVSPAIAMDIPIAARTAQGSALTVSTTLLGITVSTARKVTMETPSVGPVGCVPALIPTVLPLAVLWMEEM